MYNYFILLTLQPYLFLECSMYRNKFYIYSFLTPTKEGGSSIVSISLSTDIKISKSVSVEAPNIFMCVLCLLTVTGVERLRH